MVSCAACGGVSAEMEFIWFCVLGPEVNIWWKVSAVCIGPLVYIA